MQTRYRLMTFFLIFITITGMFYALEYGTNIRIYLKKIAQRRSSINCTKAPIYADFGTTLPQNYIVHGIDVSHFQDQIFWDKVEQMRVGDHRIYFVFMRATMGDNRADDNFKRNWIAAQKQKLICGAYHFFDPSENATEQADNFLNTVKLKKGNLPPVLDIETTENYGSTYLRKQAKIWLDKVEKNTGVQPIIYTNLRYYNKHLKGYFDEYPLWIAHYYEAELQLHDDEHWHYWQHTDRGSVNGICGDVDMDVFNGTLSHLKKMCIP